MVIDYRYIPWGLMQGIRREAYYVHTAQALEKSIGKRDKEIIKRESLEKNLVSIIDERTGEGGTGILLNEYGLILSCLHLVDHFRKDVRNIEEHRVVYADKSKWRIDNTFFAYDEEHDLALLRGLKRVEDIAPVVFNEAELELDEIVSYCSFVDGKIIEKHEGRVYWDSYDVHFPNKSRLDSLAIDGQAGRGFSGSPVFDNNAQMAGILFGGCVLDDGQEIAFVTKSIYIKQLIREVVKYLYKNK